MFFLLFTSKMHPKTFTYNNKISHEKAVNYCKKATEGVERKLLLKIPANSKENSCVGVSF